MGLQVVEPKAQLTDRRGRIAGAIGKLLDPEAQYLLPKKVGTATGLRGNENLFEIHTYSDIIRNANASQSHFNVTLLISFFC